MDRFLLTSLPAELKALGTIAEVALNVVKTNNSTTSSETITINLLSSIVERINQLSNSVDSAVTSLPTDRLVKSIE